MKKISFIIAIFVSISLCTSCEEIKNTKTDIVQNSSINSDLLIQSESPIPNTTATSPEKVETTNETTTESITEVTSTKPVTTKKVETTTTPATTTKPVTTKPITTTLVTNTTPLPAVGQNNYNALNYSEQKGVWVSYLEYLSLLKNKNESDFRSALNTIYSNIKNMGANTVYFHVRAHGDAYYPSSYFTWSKYITGSIGGNPGYDPLKIMIEEAHNKGLSFHAWINPMRGPASGDISSYPNNYPIKQWYNDPSKNGKYIVLVNGYYYLSPAYPEVRQLINTGIQEIVQNYDVDGIHIDDYFYPTTSDSFDADAYSSSGESNLGNWRRSTVSSMVSGIYSTVKQINSNVLFGVSPQGNISNNYNFQYADIGMWCSTSGYLDYVVPQIYWGFSHKTADFVKMANIWNSTVSSPNIKLVFGLAPYKIANSLYPDFCGEEKIIAREIEYSRTLPKYSGFALFSYRSLYYPDSGVKTQIDAELQAIIETLNK